MRKRLGGGHWAGDLRGGGLLLLIGIWSWLDRRMRYGPVGGGGACQLVEPACDPSTLMHNDAIFDDLEIYAHYSHN